MLVYRTETGIVVDNQGHQSLIEDDWDSLINRPDLFEYLEEQTKSDSSEPNVDVVSNALKPQVSQEVWAAGVTYFRSKTARMEESQDAGGGDFYDRVYDAERPEIFLKATPLRTVGPGESMTLRRDSNWIVPEPELVLVINREAKIVGFTVGNDLSCRDIEGENPLYLPQAKTFDRSAAIGPAVLLADRPLPKSTEIRLQIIRNDEAVVEDVTAISQIKRGFDELVEFLFRDNPHPHGCLLMTGTGIVPQDEFTLQHGDRVRITIDGIGQLENTMESRD